MHLLRVVLALCLVLALTTDAILGAPALRADDEQLAEYDPLTAMMQGMPMVSDLLNRKRRSFAQLQMGRSHYYGQGRGRRRYDRRFHPRRRVRLHRAGRGQIVDE